LCLNQKPKKGEKMIMLHRKFMATALAASLAVGMAGCRDLPGTDEQQGTVIGGASGAAVGAAVARENRLLGALLGGALGAAGGYVVGANKDRIVNRDSDSAEQAAQQAQAQPATAEQARQAATADINNDGFVTLDEVIALEKAGFTDEEIVQRLRATDQIFELTPEQERRLTAQGVSPQVVEQMRDINRAERDRLVEEHGDVIGRPAD
jgi:PAS domain-containing protein